MGNKPVRTPSINITDESDDEQEENNFFNNNNIIDDIVYSMSIPQRIDHLIFGYIRYSFPNNANNHIPKEIVLSFIGKYLGISTSNDYNLIQSNTELLIKKHAKRKLTFINGIESSSISALKIAIFGAGNVGKSTLIQRFCSNTFQSAYDPTIEDIIQNTREINTTLFHFNILDTAGHDDYSIYHEYSKESINEWMISKNCYIFMYDITKQETFREVQKLIKKSQKLFMTDSYIDLIQAKDKWRESKYGLIVGNKIDNKKLRQVERRTVQKWMEEENMTNFKFYECSVKDGMNVEEIFYECATMHMHHYLMNNSDVYKMNNGNSTGNNGCCVLL